VWHRYTRAGNRFDLLPSLCKAGLVYFRNQPDEIIASLNTDLKKAVNAEAPSRQKRLRARDYPFFFSKSLRKCIAENENLNVPLKVWVCD